MATNCNHSICQFPTSGTSAAKVFFRSARKDLSLFGFFIDLVLHTDYFAYVAQQALDDKEWKDRDPVSLADVAPGPRTKFLRDNRQELLEMFLARSVDNFQRYMVDLMREVLKKQPAILKSNQPSVSLERILSFSSMEEFLHDTIEQKISNLAYQGFTALQEWCTDKGIPIVLPDRATDVLVEFIAARNLIVHSRGVVDQKYLRTVGTSRFALGKPRVLAPRDLFDCANLTSEAVKATDMAAIAKFGLAVFPFGAEAAQSDVAPLGAAPPPNSGQSKINTSA